MGADRDALVGPDPGGIEELALRSRLGGQAGGLARGVGEGLVQVGRVVELDDLGGALDDLGLGRPVPGQLVEVAGPAAEREVRRDREVVRILVDQDEAAELVDPVLVRVEELAELLGRLDEEVGALEGSVARDLPEQIVTARVHRGSPPIVWLWCCSSADRHRARLQP